MKTIRVDEEVWEKLMELRMKGRARSVNVVLRELLGLASNPQPMQTASTGSSTESGDSQSEPVENRLPQSVTESAPSQAGTDAVSLPKKRRWSFCPQCLNMYDHQGKCPYCDVDLIPLDTDENKMLYLKLKQERGRG
jgi:predicted CopG family antitoxin